MHSQRKGSVVMGIQFRVHPQFQMLQASRKVVQAGACQNLRVTIEAGFAGCIIFSIEFNIRFHDLVFNLVV